MFFYSWFQKTVILARQTNGDVGNNRHVCCCNSKLWQSYHCQSLWVAWWSIHFRTNVDFHYSTRSRGRYVEASYIIREMISNRIYSWVLSLRDLLSRVLVQNRRARSQDCSILFFRPSERLRGWFPRVCRVLCRRRLGRVAMAFHHRLVFFWTTHLPFLITCWYT